MIAGQQSHPYDLIIGGSDLSLLSREFAQYAVEAIDAALALRPPPVGGQSLNWQMGQLARLGLEATRPSAGWPLDRYFLINKPPELNPVAKIATASLRGPPLREQVLRRLWPIKHQVEDRGAANDQTANLTGFVIEMATASGPFQLNAALRIRSYLAHRVIFSPGPHPVPVIHPNSFVVAYGLAQVSGIVARTVVEVAPKKTPQRPEWMTILTNKLPSRKRPAPGVKLSKKLPPAARAACDALAGGAWIAFWDWWFLERLSRQLPRTGASAVLTAVDQIGAYLGDPEPGQRPEALQPDWDGQHPDFMGFFKEDS